MHYSYPHHRAPTELCSVERMILHYSYPHHRAPTELCSVERRILHYSKPRYRAPAEPRHVARGLRLARWSEGLCTTADKVKGQSPRMREG